MLTSVGTDYVRFEKDEGSGKSNDETAPDPPATGVCQLSRRTVLCGKSARYIDFERIESVTFEEQSARIALYRPALLLCDGEVVPLVAEYGPASKGAVERYRLLCRFLGLEAVAEVAAPRPVDGETESSSDRVLRDFDSRRL